MLSCMRRMIPDTTPKDIEGSSCSKKHKPQRKEEKLSKGIKTTKAQRVATEAKLMVKEDEIINEP
jgi:hypothetical protein